MNHVGRKACPAGGGLMPWRRLFPKAGIFNVPAGLLHVIPFLLAPGLVDEAGLLFAVMGLFHVVGIFRPGFGFFQ